MWPARFWPVRMFSARYWAKVGEDPPPPTPTTGSRNNPMAAYLAIFMNR